MNVKLLAITKSLNEPTIAQFLEYCGRVCWRTRLAPGSTEHFIRAIMDKAHFSVIEHSSATFEISDVSRSCSHQLVRHRLASYSQESMRYVDMSNHTCVTPPDIAANEGASDIYKSAITGLRDAYRALRDLGIKKEDARFVLPISSTTRLVMTQNFRSWLHFLELRTSKHAQWEIRAVALEIKRILREHAQTIFE